MNIFTQTQMPNVPRNTFDMSHDHKLTFDMGQLVPVFNEETLPGDYWEIQTEILVRYLALVAPVMHLVEVDLHWYNVPNRIMYPNFDDIISPPDPDDIPPLQPTWASLDGVSRGDVGDYLGIPTDISGTHSSWAVLAYPIIAYSMIYDYWYRDQNLQAESTQTVTAGNNTWCGLIARAVPLVRAWEHDYFTSCLPFAQKGDIVTLPVVAGGAVDVVSKGAGNVTGNLLRGVSDFLTSTADDVVSGSSGTFEVGAQGTHTIDPNGDWEVELNSVAQDLITVRTAFATQAFLELDARGGTRYKEMVYNHFNVNSKDGRLNEPEYIGGSKSFMQISEVLSSAQTLDSSNNVVNPVGEMAGHGISMDRSKTIKYYCREHGWIMCILSTRPKTAYQQGVPKKWTRMERLDYPFPSLAHVGEQPVYNYEVYANQTTTAARDDVFGYIPRYSEMKYINSRVSGELQATGSGFDAWHLGRIFTSAPALNSNFIECVPDKRIFALSEEPGLLAHIIFNIKCTRALPMFSTPKL